ncbi:MAG: universal stress protein [Myxococcota bacterium]
MSETWLVATDFEPCAEAALDHAAEDARRLDARLVLVHAVAAPQMPVSVDSFGSPVSMTNAATTHEEVREAASKRLDEVASALRERHPDVPVEVALREGDAADAVLEAAEEMDVDRLIVGSHGKRGLKRLVLGSVAESIVRRAHVPTLVVKAT